MPRMGMNRPARFVKMNGLGAAASPAMCSQMPGFPNLPAGVQCTSDDGNTVTATGTGTFVGAPICNNGGAMQVWATGCPPGAPQVAPPGVASGISGIFQTLTGNPLYLIGGAALLYLLLKKD